MLHELGAHCYRACLDCTHQFLDLESLNIHTEQIFDDHYFSGGGDGYPDYLGDRDLLLSRGLRYARRVARHTGKNIGELLDIGSAAGFIARGFQTLGWSPHGLEPNLSMAAHATIKENVPTTLGTIESFHTDQLFDLVSMIQVIGHLPDPAATLAKVRRLLKPGGLLLVETWDCRSLAARLLGSRWHEYNPSSVLQVFSRRSLGMLAERTGFRTITCKRTTKSLRAAHAKAVIDHKYQGGRLHRYALSPALKLIPDNANIPYPSDDLFWTILEAI